MIRRRNPHTREDTAALQRDIREAGVIARDLRISWKAFGICGGAALAFLALIPAFIGLGAVMSLVACALALACFATGLLVMILAATAGYREWRTQGIRRTLVRMSPDDRAAALEPLRKDDAAETRELAATLLREFGARAEVAPAPAPAGRGDELAAT